MHECGCCAFILSFLFPPLAVMMVTGCGGHFCINLLLTLCGWVPGLIHAWYVICCIEDRPQNQMVVIQQTVPMQQPSAVVVTSSSQPPPNVNQQLPYNPNFAAPPPAGFHPSVHYQQAPTAPLPPPPPYSLEKPTNY